MNYIFIQTILCEYRVYVIILDRLTKTHGFNLALTGTPSSFIFLAMADKKQTQATDIALNKLETKVEDLVSIVNKLKDENDTLSSTHKSLAVERSKLVEKNEKTRTRVEAMISRLKAMEK